MLDNNLDNISFDEIDYTSIEVITNFFHELSSNQEPLGYEFEKVLYKNLWDLYQI